MRSTDWALQVAGRSRSGGPKDDWPLTRPVTTRDGRMVVAADTQEGVVAVWDLHRCERPDQYVPNETAANCRVRVRLHHQAAPAPPRLTSLALSPCGSSLAFADVQGRIGIV